ncbi:MAG TPA: GNAT family N-acetyltransferase [Pyrinomonadaceae bacterium]|nr:GNAT family N-acetyltransferase [Pyrinomonadaceae bacterium]
MNEVLFRVATSADVNAIAACRLTDPTAGPADPRMAAYFGGLHHPQQALLPRTGFVALDNESVIGYIAGHLTTRYECEGELQYLFVAPPYRQQGIAASLVRLLANWLVQQGSLKVCVNVNLDSPAAAPFYLSLGAVPLNKHWYVWKDISTVLKR